MTCPLRTPDTSLRPWRHARSGLLAGMLAVLIVLAQTLGLVHRVGHGPGHGPGQGLGHTAHASHTPHGSHAHAAASDLAHADASHGDDWLHQLLSGHAAGSDCLGFDQAVVGDLVATAPAWLAPVVAPGDAVPDAQRAWHLAAQAAGFLARGPPLLS